MIRHARTGSAFAAEATIRFCRGAALAGLCAGLWALAACGSGEAGTAERPAAEPTQIRYVEVSWDPNRESGVNRAGGGYRVYHGTTPGFSLGGARFVDVPYAGGETTPTRALLALAPGTHYIKVVAYSALNPAGSAPSAEVAITVPAAPEVFVRVQHD
ncbi:MAG TPA: hypothetical protein VF203_03420 [Burkholderiales bacterium]